MRAWAKGLLCLEAAAGLLIGHGTLALPPGFPGHGGRDDRPGPAARWRLSTSPRPRVPSAGGLPCSPGEKAVLQVAVGIAVGCPVDLQDALLPGRGERSPGRRRGPARGGSATMTGRFPAAVTVTRPRHPVEGRELAVIGRMRRHGQPELLLVFPDGSKRLVPESWTDAVPAGGGGARDAGHRGGPACPVGADFRALRPAPGGTGAGCTKATCQGGRSCSLFSSACCQTRFRRHCRS